MNVVACLALVMAGLPSPGEIKQVVVLANNPPPRPQGATVQLAQAQAIFADDRYELIVEDDILYVIDLNHPLLSAPREKSAMLRELLSARTDEHGLRYGIGRDAANSIASLIQKNVPGLDAQSLAEAKFSATPGANVTLQVGDRSVEVPVGFGKAGESKEEREARLSAYRQTSAKADPNFKPSDAWMQERNTNSPSRFLVQCWEPEPGSQRSKRLSRITELFRKLESQSAADLLTAADAYFTVIAKEMDLAMPDLELGEKRSLSELDSRLQEHVRQTVMMSWKELGFKSQQEAELFLTNSQVMKVDKTLTVGVYIRTGSNGFSIGVSCLTPP